MSQNEKKTYSKEELLKIIKEGRGTPSGMDDFEKDALEGLQMLNSYRKADELNSEVDRIIAGDKRKKRRTLVYFISAAASLALIISLFYLVKEDTVKAEKKELAQAEEPARHEGPAMISGETKPTYEDNEPQAKQTTEADKIIPAQPPAYIADKKSGTDQVVASPDADEKKFSAKTEQEQPNQSSYAPVQEQSKENNNITTVASPGSALSQNVDIAKNEEAPKEQTLMESTAAYRGKDEAKGDFELTQQKAKTKKSEASSYTAFGAARERELYHSPQYKGGEDIFKRYVRENLVISSPSASGEIEVEITITQKGEGKNIKILKPISGCDACNEDVVKLIKSVKSWQPATLDGKAVEKSLHLVISYNQ